MTAYGTRDGFGRYGVLDHDDDGNLVCHECGQAWRQLATHVRYSHGISAAEYRQRHGLGTTTRMVGADTRRKLAERYDEHRELHLRALESSRDPHAARRLSSTHQGRPWAPETRALRQEVGRRRKGRPLTETELEMLGDGYDLQVWADAARHLLTREGVTTGSLAAAADISQSTVRQRMQRYPPRA